MNLSLIHIYGYVIYRKTTGGSWASVTTVAGAETSSFTDTKNIASGTQYYYTVRAYMLQGRLKVYGAYDTNGILAQQKNRNEKTQMMQ